MSFEIIVVAGILVLALGLLITEWLPPDQVAVLVLVLTVCTGAVTPGEAIAGFGSPAIITVCSVYVLSAGLFGSGLANILGRQILRLGGRSETGLLLAIMGVSAFLSFFVNTVGIVALLLPAVMDLSRSCGHPPSRLLMPLTFGSLLGGLTTPFATLTNILASQALMAVDLAPFGFLDFLPLGGLAAVTGILFLAFWGKHLLPRRVRDPTGVGLDPEQLRRQYHLHDQMFVVELPGDSVLSGQSLAQSRFGSALGLHVVAVMREGRTILAPPATFLLEAGDRLLIQGTPDQLKELESWQQLNVEEPDSALAERFAGLRGFHELEVPPTSAFLGLTPAFLNLRHEFGVILLAVRRGERVVRSHLQDWDFQSGDRLLVRGTESGIERFTHQGNLHSLGESPLRKLAAEYQLRDRLFCLRLSGHSRMVGKTLRESRLGEAFGVNVVGVFRDHEDFLLPTPDQILEAGDRLALLGRTEDLERFQGIRDLRLHEKVREPFEDFESERIGMVEVVLTPRSHLVGKTLRQLQFRQKFHVQVVGIWRGDTAHVARLRDLKLQFGDALLLYGLRDHLKQLENSGEFVVLSEAIRPRPEYEKLPYALLAMGVFLVPALVGWLPISISALAGAFAMVATGCLRLEKAYAAIDLKAVVLIAGMLPLATALEKSGAAVFTAEHVVAWSGAAGPLAVAAGIFLLAALGSCVIPAAALVVLLAPITINTAATLHVSPHSLMMALALAAAGSFNSPISHPANLMILSPGSYRFADFFKVGIPLTLVILTVVLIGLPWIWPFHQP